MGLSMSLPPHTQPKLAPLANTHSATRARGDMATLAPPSPFAAQQPRSSPETTSRSRSALPPQVLLSLRQIAWSFIPRLPSLKASRLPAALSTPSVGGGPPPCFPNEPHLYPSPSQLGMDQQSCGWLMAPQQMFYSLQGWN